MSSISSRWALLPPTCTTSDAPGTIFSLADKKGDWDFESSWGPVDLGTASDCLARQGLCRRILGGDCGRGDGHPADPRPP